MKTFKDNAGHDWHLSLNIGTAMLVKDRLDIDLLQPEKGDPPLITQLGTDEYLLAKVISLLLESQFEAQNVDASQIYQFFDGPTFARAHEAFYEELIDTPVLRPNNTVQSRGRSKRLNHELGT